MKNTKNTFGRLLAYLFHHFRSHLMIASVCVVVSSLASVAVNIFLQRLIDDCITPGIQNGFASVTRTFTSILVTMAILYLFGAFTSFIYSRLMAVVTQGALKNMRNDMFGKMQTLPLRYFDTHAHGDIMSTYTNDTDAIRQLIGQSLPTLLQTILSVIVMYIMMLYYSV